MRSRRTLLATALVVVAGAVAGAGAAVYAALSPGRTNTVVRQVTVRDSQPAAKTETLSVNSIYRAAYKGVVEITVTSQTSGPSTFGGGSQTQKAQGSGFVYDAKGDIVTNQHVVDGAQSVSVKFWNGKTYGAHVVGFAIPSNTVRSVADQLSSSGKAQHAYLGVSLSSTASTARVGAVRSGTPAAGAGLKAGDVITALDGKSVASSAELESAIAAHKPGDSVSLTYTRGGKSHTVQLKLASRPSRQGRQPKGCPPASRDSAPTSS